MKTDPPSSPQPSRPPRPRGRVFDVMAPGKAIAQPTSRPVVIGHKVKAQQSQMSVSGIGEPEPHEKLLSSQDKVSVRPPEVPSQPAEVVLTPEPSVPPALAAPAPMPEEEKPPVEEDPLTAVAMEPEAPTLAAVEHPVAPPEVTDDTLPEDVSAPSIEHQVVVSHHTTAPRSTGKLIGLIALALFFVLVVVDILMDAGIITTSLPHTHFF